MSNGEKKLQVFLEGDWLYVEKLTPYSLNTCHEREFAMSADYMNLAKAKLPLDFRSI